MDPLSQGTLGAALASSAAKHERVLAYALLGGASGMAADLDFLIRSSADSLLFLEYHRQFTHSLVFVPVGAAICGLLAWPLVRRRLEWRSVCLACLLGYLTHGLLDACTSYGTQLFWPFSDTRVSWNMVSVIDPLFTLPTLAFVGLAAIKGNARIATVGFGWAVAYLLLGVVQHERAIDAGYALAASRGHEPVRLEAKPSFANLIVWKIVYEWGGRYYVDAVRVSREIGYCEGEHAAALDLDRDFPWLDAASQQARDVERFRWFSEDFLAVDDDDPHRIVDVRYSTLPDEISALWGIRLDPDASANTHARFVTEPTRGAEDSPRLVAMIAGYDCRSMISE